VIHCLPIPTPFVVGRVNVYLVEDDPLTLVDAGPNSATSLTALAAALADHGRKIADLERIVVTHQHMDHIGLVQILADRSGADVVALDGLAPWLANYRDAMEADDAFSEAIMARNGIPEDVRYALRSVSGAFRAWGAAATVTTTVGEGDTIEFAERSWTVWHRPGHSPSDTVFHDADRRELIAGDHLIKHISSNPLISRPLDGGDPADRPQALAIYLDSLAKTREMDLVRVLPGHGEEIHRHAQLIEERFRMHERRARKLLTLIADQPRTAYELAQAMWGNVAVTQAYLTLSEVLGHVDLLRNDGHVVVHDDGGVARFAVA
jgi:glyoxylase-like metal-dependent hydrolase (beta-lactamase superfamily II)